MRQPLTITSLAIVALSLSGCDLVCDDECKAQKWREEAYEQKALYEANLPPPAQGITLAEFNRLEMGMSYQQVVDIVGLDGTVMAETEIAGYKNVMVMWNGETGIGANANAMFQNGKLIQKAQFGLE